MKARKNRKLPEDTEITYPFDQEVRYVEEKERIDKVRSDIRQIQDDEDADEEVGSFVADFQNAQLPSAVVGCLVPAAAVALSAVAPVAAGGEGAR